MIFDTHAHYDEAAFDGDRGQVLAALSDCGIDHVVNIGCTSEWIRTTIALIDQYDWMYGTAGMHPEYLEGWPAENLHVVREALAHPKMVALGEIGLDYHEEGLPEKERQFAWFEEQLELARDLSLPVVIHSRDAAKDTLDIMRAHRAQEIGGVVHCFSYPKEIARDILNMGFFLGIGGVLTFKNARKLVEVVEYAPMDRLVLETDCPFLAPEPHRRERNDSRFLPLVVKKLAEIKGISEEEVIRVTEENAKRLYRMEQDPK